MSKNNLFIISGPSGAGEDSIINGLEKFFSIARVITTTTRSIRPGEKNGNPYWFISREDFLKRKENGDFVEWAEQYNNNLYGVTKQEIKRVKDSGKVGIWKIDWKGVITAKKIFPEIPTIFITVPNMQTLERRIRKRDDISEKYIRERMLYTEEWLRHTEIYDYTVVNADGELEKSIQKTAAIIKSRLSSSTPILK